MKNLTRYMFCFPQGGFNDFCQIIWNCLEYCKNFNRILVIDTRYIITFKDDFRKFIVVNDPVIYNDDIDILFSTITNGTFFPKFTDDISKISNVKQIVSKFSWKKLTCIYYDDKINMSFPLKNNDYKEQFLFFSTVQGGLNIVKLLQISNIELTLKEKIRNRFLSLPENFISIHVRNTDYTSNFKKFFENHFNDFKNKNIFLATDDYKVVNFFKENFNEKLFHFSNIPSIILKKGRGFHYDNVVIPANIMIEDCISDFLLCCLGSKYYYSCEKSGFSKNVEIIRMDNQIIKNLIFS